MKKGLVPKIVDYYRKSDKKQRIIILGIAVLIDVIILLGIAYLLAKNQAERMGENPFYLGLRGSTWGPVTWILWIALNIALIITIFKKDSIQNQIESIDEDGKFILKNKSHGDAKWMDDATMREVFFVGKPSETKETIYGETFDTAEIVAFKEKRIGATGNLNDLVIAISGDGKTSGYVLSQLIQTALRGESMVITDPKGEIYQNLSNFMEYLGIETGIINFENVEYSQFWDCLKETVNRKTGRVDGLENTNFVETFYMNSKKTIKEDYWDLCAKNLIQTVISYVGWLRETEVIEGFKELYIKVSNGDNIRDLLWKMDNEFIGFDKIKKEIRTTAKNNGYKLSEIDELLYEIEYVKPKTKFTIEEVANIIKYFEDYEDDLESIPDWHPGSSTYKIYETQKKNPQVRLSAINNTQTAFSIFNDKRIKQILSHKQIDLSKINMKQCAYFVVLPNQPFLQPLASLFVTCALSNVKRNYDAERDLALYENRENPCIPVTYMFEEFASCGLVTGNQDEFGKYVSESRGRLMSFKFIIQNISQLERIYDDVEHTIEGNCNTTVFLGGNDIPTLERIEKKCGYTTVLAESHRQNTGPFGKTDDESSLSASKAPLVSVSQLRKWQNKVLIIKKGYDPLKIKPFFWKNHPMFKNEHMQEVSIMSKVKPLEERIEEIEKEKQEIADYEMYLHGKIDELKQNIDEETGEIIIDEEEEKTEAFEDFFEAEEVEKEIVEPEILTKEEANRIMKSEEFEDDIFETDNPTTSFRDSIKRSQQQKSQSTPEKETKQEQKTESTEEKINTNKEEKSNKKHKSARNNIGQKRRKDSESPLNE